MRQRSLLHYHEELPKEFFEIDSLDGKVATMKEEGDNMSLAEKT